MAKIFVSYKYGDSNVRTINHGQLNSFGMPVPTTARHYVDLLQDHLDIHDHINKGEKDEESLAGFKDETIESKLRDKIYDSSITVVLISKNMKDLYLPEEDQWIPWEIAYSLREKTRADRTSRTNAVIAVVLPDQNNSYNYFIEQKDCQHCRTKILRTDTLFNILAVNMFNRRQPKKAKCINGLCGIEHHIDEDHSYIYPVKWDDFLLDINGYIALATKLNENLHEYELRKGL